MDLAADDENEKEPGAGFLPAGTISTIESAFPIEKCGTVCCCMLAAATMQTLPGGKLGAIDSAPHPNPEDVRGLVIGATTGERMVVV